MLAGQPLVVFCSRVAPIVATKEPRTKEIVAELREHIGASRNPTIASSFHDVVLVGDAEDEQQIMLKAEEGRPVIGFTISYGENEVYQVFILGGHYT
jgi:hypothetical protein